MTFLARRGAFLPVLSLLALASCGGDAEAPQPFRGVAGIEEAQLTPDYWIARLEDPEQVVMDTHAIEAQNARLMQVDPSMHDLRAFAETVTGDTVRQLIEDLADPPASELFDESGNVVAPEAIDAIVGNRNLDAVPGQQATRYGLVVHRASLRTFPSNLRVFKSGGDTNIDRFQESALFPGTPVVIAHESSDGHWLFVVSPRYAAWIEKRHVAEGSAGEVFGYSQKTPYRIVTGATVHTVFNPEEPGLSQLQLDMGVRVPALTGADALVDGQHPYTAHVIELPVRDDAGKLNLRPALLQKNADSAPDYLPLSRANIIRQGFKFLGERYGWGHSYNGRDCSGFVSEVYRSMGAIMPRNTSAQSVSPALQKRVFTDEDDLEARLREIRSLNVGDLVYIPGHVMMVIGTVGGEPWLIHDTTGFSYRAEDGTMLRVPLHSVAVTPLMPLQFNETESYVDRMTSIVRIVPDSYPEAPPSS